MPNKPKSNKPKMFSFTQDEFLYVSEKRAQMELTDTLIRRFIAAKVMKRLNLDGKKFFVKVTDDGTGIEASEIIPPEPSLVA